MFSNAAWNLYQWFNDVFPNLYTVLKIYLTLPITSCEAERAFSKVTIKKNYRTAMMEDKLNWLSIFSIESDITKSLTYDEAIKAFTQGKSRKASFNEWQSCVEVNFYWLLLFISYFHFPLLIKIKKYIFLLLLYTSFIFLCLIWSQRKMYLMRWEGPQSV